ncbi:peptide chain release factor N(5)-glutamine methyltransferase [Pasteurellaceae bacterium LIM206]|nr:peptide chain release factor N(5)-glutamine methyltransferase [Pasteurellaceae bacterium LIM206]
MTYADWLAYASQFLFENLKSDPHFNARTDAVILLQFVTQKPMATLRAFDDTALTSDERARLQAMLERRAQGEPIAYILGETGFWSLSLNVSPHTLIPRPDSEILVEQVLELIKHHFSAPHFTRQRKISLLDLGTGTGAIALAVAAELKKCGVEFRILGVDKLADVVGLAQANALRNQLPEVEFLQSDWFSRIVGRKFDFIVSNPPYIDARDEHLARGDVRFEPLTALVAGEQGYADLRYIIEHAPRYLNPNGWLLLEHGWRQGEKVRKIFAENAWRQVVTVKDYGNNERVTLANRK